MDPQNFATRNLAIDGDWDSCISSISTPSCLFHSIFISGVYEMAPLARVAWRSARAALRQNNGVNPVKQALGVQGVQQYAGAFRNYATVFERTKPHVNVGVYWNLQKHLNG